MPPTPIAQVQQLVDEARLREYVRRIVLETIAEHVQRPRDRNRVPRPVAVRATVARVPAADTAVPLDIVERLLIDGMGREKGQQMIKDLRNAMTRGRRTKADDGGGGGDEAGVEVPAAGEDETPDDAGAVGVKCRQCDTSLVLHYDRANRYRGCDYALEHLGEEWEGLIR